jgi:hypothetical protein
MDHFEPGADLHEHDSNVRERLGAYVTTDDKGVHHIDAVRLFVDCIVVMKAGGSSLDEVVEGIEELWDRVYLERPH